MVYGYDEAQLFPVQSLYDTGMINMYLSAVQKEYERGLADRKEFISKYGDFVSPFAKDVDAWNNETIGAYNTLIQELEKRGIDPNRSKEGQAAIQRFINSRNYGDLAKLRHSAEAGKKYMDARATLASRGLYDPEFEKFRLGGVDPLNHSTLRDGMWTETSPVEMKNLYDLTHDRFDPLLHATFDLGPGRDEYHRRQGVSVAQMEPIAKTMLDGIKNTIYYPYYLNKYGSDEGIEKAMIAANEGVLHEVEVDDKWAQTQWENRQANRRAALGGGGGGSGSEVPSAITLYQLATFHGAYGDTGGFNQWALSGFGDKDGEMSKRLMDRVKSIKDFDRGTRGMFFNAQYIASVLENSSISDQYVYSYGQLNTNAYGASDRFGKNLGKKKADGKNQTSLIRSLLKSGYTTVSDNKEQSVSYDYKPTGKVQTIPVWINVDGKRVLQNKLFVEMQLVDAKGNPVRAIDSKKRPIAKGSSGALSADNGGISNDGRFVIEAGRGIYGTDKTVNITESSTSVYGTAYAK